MLNSADDLARRGFWIFPVVPGQKSPPAVKDWQTSAARNADPWKLSPRHNIGVSTSKFGDDAALIVVDVDVKGCPAVESILRVEMEYGDLPETFTVATPRGGRHLYYWHTEPVKQGVNVLGRGVDIRSKGGYVVGPGSKTVDGEYAIAIDGPVAQAPDWLVQACGKVNEREPAPALPSALDEIELAYGRALGREFLSSRHTFATEGGRNDMGFAVAAKLKDFGVPQAKMADFMREYWQCEPMLDDAELDHVIRSAFNYGQNAPGSKNMLAEFDVVEAQPATEDEEDDFIMAKDFAIESSAKPLVRGLLDQGALSVWYGPSGAGKTFNLVDLSTAIARGIPWRGRPVARGCVLYVALEGARGLQKRFMAHAIHHGYDHKGLVIGLSSKSRDLTKPGDAGRVAKAAARLVKRTGLPCMLIVVDTLNRAMGDGDENSNADVGRLLTNFEKIQAHTGAHVAVVHHPGKDVTKGARGASALRAGIDSEFEISAGEIKHTKSKDGEMVDPMYYVLHPVAIGVSDDLEPITSAVSLPEMSAPVISGDVDEHQQPGKALRILAQLIPKHGGSVPLAVWKKACHGHLCGDSQKSGTHTKAFRRAVAALEVSGHIKNVEDFIEIVKRENPAPEPE